MDSGAFEELVGPRLSTATFSTAGFIRTVVSKSWIAGACVDGKVYIWLRYPESNEETGIERVAVITSSGILPNNTADDRKNQEYRALPFTQHLPETRPLDGRHATS